jgi:hypothetical protein
MKLLGAMLLLGSAGAWGLRRKRENMLPLEIGRALLRDLAVLRYHIQICRTPLPEVLTGLLPDGLGQAWFWAPLAERLRREGACLPECWQETAQNLPPPLDRLLAPIGPLLPAGDETFSRAVEETREELTGYLRAETARQASQGRITMALCLAGAGLVILVLL